MPSLQPGPLFRTDADGVRWYRDGNDTAAYNSYLESVRSYRDSAREEALSTARLNPEMDQVQKYADCLQGIGWHNKARPKYKSDFFDNRMNNARMSDLALLTDVKPTIFVSTGIEAYKQQADMASKAIQSEWVTRKMDMDLVNVVDIAKLNGTAFWRNGAAFPGRLSVTSCGPESVLPLQPQMNLQKSTAILYRTWKSVQELRQRFPYTSTNLERESTFTEMSAGGETRFARPDEMPEFTWNGLTPQMKRTLGIRTNLAEAGMLQGSMFSNIEMQEFWIDDPSINESTQSVLIKHPYLTLKQHNYWYWVKPGQRLYPRKRLLVFGGRRLLYDGPSPFWHGLYPFTCLRLNPVPWSFWGLSKYRDLYPINRALNDIGAGILDMIKLALNPVAVTKMNSMAQGAWKEFYPDLPRGKVMLMPNAQMTDLTYMNPPAIPSWVLQFHQYLTSEFDRLSGAMDINAMTKKKQVPGGDTIEAMKESMNSVTRLEGRWIEDFLEESGVQAVSNFFQYFDLKTRVMMLANDGISWEDLNRTGPNLMPEGVPKEDHWRNFAMKIGTGSLLSSAKDREKSMAIQLASRGMIPLKYLYEKLEIPMENLAELEKEKQAQIVPSGKSPRSSRGQRNGQAA